MRGAATKEIVLVRVRQALQAQLANEALHTLRVEAIDDFMRDALNVRAQWDVWAERPEKETHRLVDHHPANWWQHLKRSHFPAWALRRWPAKYRTVSREIVVSLQRCYPDSPIVGQGRPVYAVHAFADASPDYFAGDQ